VTLPPWVVLHVPHDATLVPASVRDQFVVSDQLLAAEIERWTDHHTADLFVPADGSVRCARAPVSRLVVDVERFVHDDLEPASRHGFGVVYTKTSTGIALRRPLHADDRAALLRDYYVPHHLALEAMVETALQEHGRCLVIDCHSFPEAPLPHEPPSANARPDICIGTDSFHTPEPLAQAFEAGFAADGWRVLRNDPFAGALVPASRYQRDRRVLAIMVEAHRRLYLDGAGAARRAEFAQVAESVQRCCAAGVRSYASQGAVAPAAAGPAPQAEYAAVSAIEPSLQRAYLDTHFVVSAAPPFTLRIGVVSPELLAEHRASGHPGSAFVTACNPFSRSLDDAENRARQAELLAELHRRGLHCRAGHGQHPINDWPAEPSYLVLGLDRAAACELGRRWEQNAIVWAGPDAIPQLILLR
jgi:N-formylglutamate deformylase